MYTYIVRTSFHHIKLRRSRIIEQFADSFTWSIVEPNTLILRTALAWTSDWWSHHLESLAWCCSCIGAQLDILLVLNDMIPLGYISQCDVINQGKEHQELDNKWSDTTECSVIRERHIMLRVCYGDSILNTKVDLTIKHPVLYFENCCKSFIP